jgi:hypothetical protein
LSLETRLNWPVVAVNQVCEERSFATRIDDDEASFELIDGGHTLFRRREGTATLYTPEPLEPARLLHPFLSSVGSVFGHWHGREPIHGGAYLGGGKAWVLLGDHEAGKSTTLGKMATLGIPIVADDLTVVADGEVLSAPRCLDLRVPAAERLGLLNGERPLVRGKQRMRMALEEVPARIPLGGFVVLTWGPRLAMNRVAAAERLERLGEGRMLIVPLRRPAVMLELASAPMYELQRPYSWDSLDESVEMLLEIAGGA